MLAKIEGGEFQSVIAGDERDATIVNIVMPYGFALSNRHLVILELEDAKEIEMLICMNEDEKSIRACSMIENAQRAEMKLPLVGG